MLTPEHIKFGGKAIYEIRVEGEVNPGWQDRFGNMTMKKKRIADNRFVTVLTGLIQDEAALMGVLETLYELHQVILSVNRLSTYSGGNHTDL